MSQLSDPLHRITATADTRRVTRVLAGVAFALMVLVVTVTSSSGDTVELGMNPRSVGSPSFPDDLGRDDDDDNDSGDEAPTVITVPVPTPMPIAPNAGGGDIIIGIPLNPAPAPTQQPSSPSTPTSPRPRTANGASPPQIERFYVETENPTARRPVRFRWWAGDPDGYARYWHVDFGDGTQNQSLGPDPCEADPTDPVSERPPFEHTYNDPGTYRVVLTVKSSGSCGNGPTQAVTAELSVNVGVLGVSPGQLPSDV